MLKIFLTIKKRYIYYFTNFPGKIVKNFERPQSSASLQWKYSRVGSDGLVFKKTLNIKNLVYNDQTFKSIPVYPDTSALAGNIIIYNLFRIRIS